MVYLSDCITGLSVVLLFLGGFYAINDMPLLVTLTVSFFWAFFSYCNTGQYVVELLLMVYFYDCITGPIVVILIAGMVYWATGQIVAIFIAGAAFTEGLIVDGYWPF